jgi:hypothetical protein
MILHGDAHLHTKTMESDMQRTIDIKTVVYFSKRDYSEYTLEGKFGRVFIDSITHTPPINYSNITDFHIFAL